MTLEITPSSVQGEVVIPPSKSMAHRAIICACLARGHSKICNIAYSKDILATLAGMEQLGARVTCGEDFVEIEGIDCFDKAIPIPVDCKESGSTLRFLIPLFSLCEGEVTFTGASRLMERPQGVYADIYHTQGLVFKETGKAIVTQGRLKAGTYTLKGDVSSQFISGLLFLLPLLQGDSILHILPPFESRSYVALTMEMQRTFGVQAMFLDDNTIYIAGGQGYVPQVHTVEGDYSQLAFHGVLGAISGQVTCKGVCHDSLQGDKKIIEILRQFGARVTEIPQGYQIGTGDLQGGEIDLGDCPDLGPILTILGMYAKGTTRIYNAGRLRYKESDRISAMETELKKWGVQISSTKDEIFIIGGDGYRSDQPFQSHNDHRVVMSIAVAATRAGNKTVIESAQAITKSYPNFFEDLEKTGVSVFYREQ